MAPKVVITNRVHSDVVQMLEARCQVVANERPEPWNCDQLLTKAGDANALMVFMNDCIDQAFLDCCPKLEIIASVLKGFDNIDVDACNKRGIWVTVVSERLTAATAELTIALLLAVSRHITQGDAYVRRDYPGWRPIFYGRGLQGSTVGILGMGRIGQAVAKRLKPFDCQIVYFEPNPVCEQHGRKLGTPLATANDVLHLSDFLVLAVPLTARTRHLIDADAIRQMKPECYVINTARGSIVDEEAIADALGMGVLGGYAADVFETEDLLRRDKPASISPRLVAERNHTVFTPHLGSAECRVRFEAEYEMAQSILDHFSGKSPRGAVNDPRQRRAIAC